MNNFKKILAILLYTSLALSSTMSKVDLIDASENPPKGGKTEFGAKDGLRFVKSNGLPKHKIGKFPNKYSPHEIKEQKHFFQLPLNPKLSKKITKLGKGNFFGISMTGIPFMAHSNKFKKGREYEALSKNINLGLDQNHAHVDKKGIYHFHGLPTALLMIYGLTEGSESPIIGWAADGFAIYALYGKDGNKVKSSYMLKKGKRSDGSNYDGTFTTDYTFVKGIGDLDECNGMRFNGKYAYFLTNEFPFIPRCFKGTPHASFMYKN